MQLAMRIDEAGVTSVKVGSTCAVCTCAVCMNERESVGCVCVWLHVTENACAVFVYCGLVTTYTVLKYIINHVPYYNASTDR